MYILITYMYYIGYIIYVLTKVIQIKIVRKEYLI